MCEEQVNTYNVCCSGSHNQLIESVIVLEEFCKELAAIAFVKHQHQHLVPL